MGKITKIALLIFAALTLGIVMSFGCGAELTYESETRRIEPAPTGGDSFGHFSGYNYGTGGDHYKLYHSFGAPYAKPGQESQNGKYQVK